MAVKCFIICMYFIEWDYWGGACIVLILIYVLDCILKDLTVYISTMNIREYNFPLSWPAVVGVIIL